MKAATLFAFVSPIALLTSGAAWAQDAQPADETTQATSTGDIVVTARRREENLQDVPISITAVSGDALAERGVVGALDLQNQVPSLSVSTQGANRGGFAFAIV